MAVFGPVEAPYRAQFDNARDPLTARNALGIDSVLASYLTTANAATIYATIANFPAGAWTAWSPTITAGSGTITSTTINSARYVQLGKSVFACVDITITNAGTGSGVFAFTIPVTLRAGSNPAIYGRETVLTGNILGGFFPTTATACVVNYNNSTCIATNARILATVIYEAA